MWNAAESAARGRPGGGAVAFESERSGSVAPPGVQSSLGQAFTTRGGLCAASCGATKAAFPVHTRRHSCAAAVRSGGVKERRRSSASGSSPEGGKPQRRRLRPGRTVVRLKRQ